MSGPAKSIACTVAAGLAATVACGQWNFELDQSFQTPIVQQYVNDLVILPDGKLLLSGGIRFPGDMSNRGSARLLSDGQRDLAFPMFPQTTGGGRLTPWNGMYYVDNGLVRRLDGEGLLDPGFISMNLGPYFNSILNGDYHVYPDGRVLLSGLHHLSDTVRGFVGDYGLIWFSNEGYLDTTRIHRQGNGALNRIVELPNGQFVCGGLQTQWEGEPVGRIFRVYADGIPDTTFQTGVFAGEALDYLGLEDGRVYAAGVFRRSQAPEDTLRLVRFLPNGDLDPAFVIPQFALGTLPGSLGPVVVSVQHWLDGNLIVTGYFHSVNGLLRKGICMLDSTGQVLDAFSNAGVGPYVYQGFTYASVEAIAYDTANAQLYLCGAYTGYDDGTMDDPLQRFVTRLNVEDIGMGAGEQHASEFSLCAYPNPTNGNVIVEVEEPPKDATLVLRDALGRELLRQRVNGYYTTLDLSSLAEGMFTLELRTSEQRVLAERLVIQR